MTKSSGLPYLMITQFVTTMMMMYTIKKEAEQAGGNWEIYSISKKSEKNLRDYCMSMKA